MIYRLPVLLIVALCLLAGSHEDAASQTDGETKLLRFPDISAEHVVFVYAGDLWIADRAGGDARRLTTHAGDELFPKFSPDGAWVAFTGEYDGNSDVYIIPTAGGEPRRLTYHPFGDNVLDWTPDGKSVLFRSARISAPVRFSRMFTVNVDGGLPEVLPMPIGGPGSYSPDGTRIAYNPGSREFRTWKRYKGGRTTYIGIYGLADNSYSELVRDDFNDFFPMWDASGLYFVSDREKVMNLYRWDEASGDISKQTDFDEYDVKFPSLGPGSIVYENGGELHVLDLASGNSSKLTIKVNSELLVARPEMESVARRIGWIDISPTGKRAVLGARGDIFTVPAENGATRNLTSTPGIHERQPSWSPDGKFVAYFSDRTGEWEVYLQPQAGGEERKLTRNEGPYPHGMLWSPDSEKLLVWDKESKLWMVDADSGRRTLVAESEWRYGVQSPAWSPDSKWVAYSSNDAKGSGAIYLYEVESKKSTQVTDHFYDDTEPTFDLGGKYLYFASPRHFYPSIGNFDWHWSYYQSDGLFAVVLAKDEPSPFAPENDEEEVEDEGEGEDEDKEEDDGEDEDNDDEEADEEDESITIDLDGIGSRIVQIPVEARSYFNLKAGDGKLFYMSMPFTAQQAARPDSPDGGTLHVYMMEDREQKDVLDGIQDYELDKKADKLLYIAGPGGYGIVDAEPEQKASDGRLDMSGLQVRVDYKQEWAQLFEEAWRIERDFFWDPDMGGVDWNAMGDRYRKLVPWVAHRSDLNYLIGEMVAELATGHAYVGGGDMPDRERVNVGLLGVDFEADGAYYRLAKIYPGEDWNPGRQSPLTAPGLDVGEGDYLIAVNGVEIPSGDNPYAYFQGLSGRLVTLTVNGEASPEGARDILIETIGSDGALRYMDWVEGNRQKVDQATDGRCGYMHVPDTSIRGLIEFDKYLQAQTEKDALIVDERFNAGGMIPDFYTNKLKKQMLNLITPRDGKDTPWPPQTIYGPKVMLANEFAGSGGDAFPWFFKREGIGPVVGTRTWGGLVGISRRVPMIDGGVVTAPEVAFWSTDNGGEWMVENYGVDPDVEVRNDPNLVVEGHDPQLEKAIEIINDDLKDYAGVPNKRPRYPRGK